MLTPVSVAKNQRGLDTLGRQPMILVDVVSVFTSFLLDESKFFKRISSQVGFPELY